MTVSHDPLLLDLSSGPDRLSLDAGQPPAIEADGHVAVLVCHPAVRAELALAVDARRHDRDVSQEVWRLVADCLEVTGLALDGAVHGPGPSSSSLLAACALQTASTAGLELAGARISEVLAGRPQPAPIEVERQAMRRATPPTIDRTSVRLAGLLLGPIPADADLLLSVLVDHSEALARWRALQSDAARRLSGVRRPGSGPGLHQS